MLGVFVALLGAGAIGATLADDGDGERVVTATLPAVGGAAAPKTEIGKIYAAALERGRFRPGRHARRAAGSGTGFVIDNDGTIVTNAHVVDTATSVLVRFDDKSQGVDRARAGHGPLLRPRRDQGRSGGPRAQAARFADSDTVAVGDSAIAIGYPLGLDRTATAGIVSGVGRKIEAPNGFSHRRGHPDRCPHQPRQLGRPAARRARARDRSQLPDRDRGRVKRQRRHRLRGAVEHRASGRAEAARRPVDRPRLPGRVDRAVGQRAAAPRSATSTPAGPPSRPACVRAT